MKEMQQIPEVQTSIRMTATFNGYNHRDVIADGEMFHTENLSDDLHPMLTNRKKRGITSYDVSGQASVPLLGIHGRDKLVYIRGDTVYYNGSAVEFGYGDNGDEIRISTAANMQPKKIVSMGAYVCIWPDKLYFNTTDVQPELKMLERPKAIANTNIKLQMCKLDGTDITVSNSNIKSTAPKNPTNGMYWIDTSGSTHVLRQYTSATKEWIEIPTVYVKIIEDNGGIVSNSWSIKKYLNEYDTIEISGLKADSSCTDLVKKQVDDLNGSKIVYGMGTDSSGQYTKYYIIVQGMLDVANPTMDSTTGSTAHFDRKVPDLDFIIESNNRLWGCKYGTVNGKTLNEIYASKLGDPENWSCFMGLSTDSYTMSVGSDGPWTGAITQRGFPVFFKEQCIHQISGTSPSSYQLNTIHCKGVQAGSWRSVQILNEVVYYKASDDVMAFDGNMPYIISDNLGDVRYSDARAGVQRNKYFISMKNADNEWNLFTYNTRSGLWYREDNLKALGFGAVGDELYAIDEAHNTLVSIFGTFGTLEADPPWSAEFGLSGVEYTPGSYGNMTRSEIRGSHYLSRFDIRMTLEEGGYAELEIQYDSSGHWEKKGEIHGNRMDTFVLPVVPKRCDHLRFRLKGQGKMRIYSISRIMEVGNDG